MSSSGNVIDLQKHRAKSKKSSKKGIKNASLAPIVDITEKRQEMIEEEKRGVKRTLLTEFIGVHLVVPNKGLTKCALYDISELAGSHLPMEDMLKGIHAIVGSLMYAENFFIVLHNEDKETMRFLYFSDTEDEKPGGDDFEVPLSKLDRSLTWYILKDGKPLMGTTEDMRTQVSGPLGIYGADGGDFLGVPMINDGRVAGALVVQSYNPGRVFSYVDKDLLQFVASHILTALERKQHKQELEQKVIERTKSLQLEVQVRQRSERLQAALFQIAQLATEDVGEIDFYQRVHKVVGTLMSAENFLIALLSEDRTYLDFPYYVDKQMSDALIVWMWTLKLNTR